MAKNDVPFEQVNIYDFENYLKERELIRERELKEEQLGLEMAKSGWIVQEYAKFKHLRGSQADDEKVYVDTEKACGYVELPMDAFSFGNSKGNKEFSSTFLCIDFTKNRFAFAILGMKDSKDARSKHAEVFSSQIECYY